MSQEFTLKNIFFHAAILIPIEFGLLHATALGPMITTGFQNIFAAIGFGAGLPARAVGDALILN